MGRIFYRNRLNESTFRNCYSYILNESQESDSQKLAMKLVMDKFGWDKERADQFVRVALRNNITSLRDKKIGKFTLGVTRMYCDDDLRDATTISALNYTLKLLSAHLNEYDKNLNGLSAQELISKFEQARRDNLEQNKKDIEAMSFGKSDYKIVRIDSFKDAKKYYKYTNPNSRWCLTHMEDQYMNYTRDETNQLYFCLKKGFTNVKCISGENTPLDDYGLSMLSVIVNENGELVHCTCRWNHDNGGTDNVMDEKEISQIVGVNFYQTFKPNNKWNDIIDTCIKRIRNGEPYYEVFDKCYNFHDGYACVVLNGKCNFINTDGDFISKQWFNMVYDFHDGYACVVLNGKCNYINTNGDFISKQWFDNGNSFHDGYACVRLKGKSNYINTDGDFISKQWFDRCYDFYDGYAYIRLNDKYNYINTDGDFISKQWFDDSNGFHDGYACIRLNDKYNYINTDGEFISKQWFDRCYDFHDGFGRVILKNKWMYIDTKGNLYDHRPVHESKKRVFYRNKLNEFYK